MCRPRRHPISPKTPRRLACDHVHVREAVAHGRGRQHLFPARCPADGRLIRVRTVLLSAIHSRARSGGWASIAPVHVHRRPPAPTVSKVTPRRVTPRCGPPRAASCPRRLRAGAVVDPRCRAALAADRFSTAGIRVSRRRHRSRTVATRSRGTRTPAAADALLHHCLSRSRAGVDAHAAPPSARAPSARSQRSHLASTRSIPAAHPCVHARQTSSSSMNPHRRCGEVARPRRLTRRPATPTRHRGADLGEASRVLLHLVRILPAQEITFIAHAASTQHPPSLSFPSSGTLMTRSFPPGAAGRRARMRVAGRLPWISARR